MNTPKRLTVIMPVHNGSVYLKHSVPAILASMGNDTHLLVVDDCSTDDTAHIAQQLGATAITLNKNLGPSGARNAGAAISETELLAFVDADVVVNPHALHRMVNTLDQNPHIAAVFGSYDDDPADQHIVSSFKNLMHHYVHQTGNPHAQTFWTGCGAIRREVFNHVGPFNPVSLTCVEDIDYGYRLNDAGYQVKLDKDIQGKHLKRWRLWGLIKTDVMERGIPWTIMMRRRGKMEGGLNLGWQHRISALLAIAIVACTLLIIILPAAGLLGLAISLATFLSLQKNFYSFLSRKKGIAFLPPALIIHIIYYLYSCISLVAGLIISISTKHKNANTDTRCKALH